MLAVTKGRFIVVEYTLEFVKAIGTDGAQLRIRELSSEAEELHLGLVPTEEKIVNVNVDTDLAQVTHNPHLRGFKVMEIGRHVGEMRVRFTNEVQISESETHHFSGTRLDNNPTREVAAAHVDQPIPDFFGRAAEETFLTRATLWRIFQDHLKQDVKDVDAGLASREDLREHFHDARVEFYSAEGLRTFSRDTLPAGEFEKLQDEVHSGIKDDVRGEHADGYRRVVAVVKTARALQPTSNPLTTRIHTRDRGGICHQLANDGKARWVK